MHRLDRIGVGDCFLDQGGLFVVLWRRTIPNFKTFGDVSSAVRVLCLIATNDRYCLPGELRRMSGRTLQLKMVEHVFRSDPT